MTYSHPHRSKWQRRRQLINQIKYYGSILYFLCLGGLMLWTLGFLVQVGSA